MRRAYFDVGWMMAKNGAVLGLSLGYDRCAEHEWGISGILSAFGVPSPEFPMGIADRQVAGYPPTLRWVETLTKPKDKRRKSYPTAMLSLQEADPSRDKQSLEQFLNANELYFCTNPRDTAHNLDLDVVAAWASDGFSVWVRGAENIERLRQLQQAFAAKDVAIALPWARSFFQGGLSFVVISQMTVEEKQAVTDRDEAHQSLQLAAKATGVGAVLAAANKGYYALGPGWFDDKKDEVIFFLNPMEQARYNHGWFTVAELVQWSQDKGPVIRDPKLEAFAKQPENYDWTCRLLKGMNAKGIKPRHHEKLVWLDEAKTVPGLRYRATRDTEHLLPSGNYAFSELMAKFADPLIKEKLLQPA